jgi:single-strand DNA-binding protein
MRSVNKVTFLGHLVADPELKTTKSGKSVLSFALATNNEWRNTEGEKQESTDFHRIVVWEKLAEICAKHLFKGSPIYMEGRLSNRSYEGKDKIRRYITETIANSVHILKWKAEKNTIQTKELAAAA